MLGATQHDLPGFEQQANRFVGGPDARLLRHVVGEALQRPHRIGLSQAARPTPDSRQHLLLILFGDFRRGPGMGRSLSPSMPSASQRLSQLRTVWFTSRTIFAMAGAVMRCSPANSTI